MDRPHPLPLPHPRPPFPWTLFEVSLVGLFLLAYAATGLHAIFHPTPPAPYPGLRTLLPSLALLPIFTFTLLIGRHLLARAPLADAFGSPTHLGRAALLGLAAFPLTGLLSAATTFLADHFGLALPYQNAVSWLLRADALFPDRIVLALHAALLAPLVEELLFRGILLSAFTRRPRLGTLLTATLFSLTHASLLALLPMFLIGLLLAHLTLRHRSLLPAIVFHIAFNSANLLLIFLYPDLAASL